MRRLTRLLPGLLLALSLAAVASAASPSPGATTPPPGPPYPEPVEGRAVYDFARVLRPDTVAQAEAIVDAIEAQTKAEVVVYTQALGRDDITTEEAEAHAAALMDEWGIGRAGINDGLVILLDLDTSLEHGQAQLYAGSGFAERYMTVDQLQDVYQSSMLPYLADGDLDTAVLVGLGEVVGGTLKASEPPGSIDLGPPPGPPFPEPEVDRAVYDHAGILSGDAIVEAEAVIDAIEARTGAEVVVYTQNSGEYPTTEETEAKARALMDQWGVGRAGFNDGLVIFFDMDPSLQHGQVQLYAGPGFEATYLSNQERQSIYENDMLPHLRSADFDAALAAALTKVDRAASADHAADLQRARQLNAVVGLVGAPIVFMGLVGWAAWNWRRFGKDPVYLDSPSIYVPAPPPDLTAASGAMVIDGGTSRRALTTAMLDLASRGLIAFREESGILGLGRKVGIDLDPASGDEIVEAQRARNRRRPMSPAEQLALRRLQPIGTGNYIEPDELLKFGAAVDDFNRALEKHVVEQGWFAEAPSKAVTRWVVRSVLAILGGAGLVFLAFQIPMSGLALVGGALIIGGVFLLLLSRAMPAVTMSGAMIRAQLAAYRRTLKKTMEQSRSLDQVVAAAGLDWLDTPDQAIVWGTALGLQDEIEKVLELSLIHI